jgi:hypothetical protein
MPIAPPTGTNTTTPAPAGANVIPSAADTAAMFGNNTSPLPPGPGEGDPNAVFTNLLEQQKAAADAKAAADNAKAANEEQRLKDERQAQLTAEQLERQSRFKANSVAHPLFFVFWQTAKFQQDMLDAMADLVPADNVRGRNAYKLMATTFAVHQKALEDLSTL